ncbi:CpaD family pilus assembly lipoprotein [Kordiimonas lacus]|uniref:Pilus biogenesis CpaD protein (Pilus_cpaD) n=1 Tax=Kordiimonas lacus TaxID=637679 RepID=A0A1G6Y7W9_9PROT|nr:CpaD family pilus assembly lipoprotein [Kordiimonas lacus]SDD85686.1 Pilus biogenesis CpaD protein (pilus_cpaD) [Kordiimonas lacus]
MTNQAKILKSAFLGLGLLGLTACQHTDVAAPSHLETTMRNSVQMIRLPYEIKAEEDGTSTPSGATYSGIQTFLKAANVSYGDVLMLDGGNASDDRLMALEDYFKSQGYTYGGTATLGGMPSGGSVMLYLERYVVTTPNCGEWAAETSNNQRNNPSSFLGCSNTANLGLMVANPRDLIAGQSGAGFTSTAVDQLIAPLSGEEPVTGAGGLPGDKK